MNRYIDIISEVLEKSLNKEKKFNLIKLENFISPKIYLEVCKKINDKLSSWDAEFIAKLSLEKYNNWIKVDEYREALEELDKFGWIEKKDHITKWRNYPFTGHTKATILLLMGTEDVEDKGSLNEFNTICTETIEYYIGTNFSKLMTNYTEEFNSKIDNIYTKIFSYTEKDLLRLSSYFETVENKEDYEIIEDIFRTLNSWWNIPNIFNIFNEIKIDKLEKGKIDILEKAYKFSRRIGIDSYQSDNKLKKFNSNFDGYFSDQLIVSSITPEELGEYASKIPLLKEDIVKYIKGIEINRIKNKLFSMNFSIINKILNIKSTSNPNGSDKTIKVKGDPFIALSLPILIEIGNLKSEEKNILTNIKIKINKIALTRTREIQDNDEDQHSLLIGKWNNYSRFLGGIETLINRQALANLEGEEIITTFVYQNMDGIEKYPFDLDNVKELVDTGILKSSSENESKSKIELEYTLTLNNDKQYTSKYIWLISDYDTWSYSLNMLNDINFLSIIDLDERVIPFGYSEKLDTAIISKNEEEFYYNYNAVHLRYRNLLNDLLESSYLRTEVSALGKATKDLLHGIRRKGLFSVIFNSGYTVEYLQCYEKCMQLCINFFKDKKIEDKNINILSKAFLLSNSEETDSKSLIGAIIPIYNPMMLEKVVERYSYLSNAFKELFDLIIQSKEVNKGRVNNAYLRFNQLSTITFSASVLLGEGNEFVICNNAYNFFNSYGNIKGNNILQNANVTYSDIDYEDDEKITLEKSPASNYISYTIKEYLHTYPSKIDGFTISFIKPSNYRDIIAGLHDILKILKKDLDHRIKVNLIIYTDDFRAQGAKYFTNWIENNFTEDDNISLQTSIKLLKEDLNLAVMGKQLDKVLEKTDLVFFNNIMSVKEISPEFVKSLNIEQRENRYPVVYLPLHSYEEKYRKLNITQKQFSCEYIHSQFMVYLKDPNASNAEYRIVKKMYITDGDYLLLNKLHDKSNWVIILDENIDKKLLNENHNKVIGFSTGEGYFGELNSTISSNDSVKDDLKVLIKKRLRMKFSDWSVSEIDKATVKCLEMTRNLDGADILKAINPADEAINNYLAYLMTYEIENSLSENDNSVLRKIISLDSYNHLFDDTLGAVKFTGENFRPDLLVLELVNDTESNKYKIYCKLIECKLGQYSFTHIDKARNQIEFGYNHFNNVWNPENDTVQKRFWFNQLYRILICNNKELDINEDERLSAICEGEFKIEFNKELYLYWVDKFDEEIIEEFSGDDKLIKEHHLSMKIIRKLLIGSSEVEEVSEEKSNAETTAIIIKDIELEDKDKKSKPTKEETNASCTNDKNSTDNDVSTEIENFYKDDEKSIVPKAIINIFKEYINETDESEKKEVEEKLNKLKSFLGFKKVKIIPKDIIIGPDIVRYSFQLDFTNSVNDVKKKQEDIQLMLGLNELPFIFIEDGLIKMDTPRQHRQMVGIKTMYQKINEMTLDYKNVHDHFYALIGADVLGEPHLLDLSDPSSPHLLIAGQTGSGKSVLLSSILTSIMSFYTSEEVEMVLVDPKRVELTAFRKSPFTKIVATEVDEAINLLQDLLRTMEDRYKLFEKEEVKNINEYNNKNPNNKLKRVLMVFDEYASMMQADKEYVKIIESTIVRLSQEARAAGVHLIICTQSPKAEIITTTIRNNLNARIGLKVADSTASKVILDESGAESLLGKGDMLIKTADSSKLTRIKSPYVSNDELSDFIECLNNF
ncbi:DNA translocase FtsK [uncultured Clostridium sp.]|uniref:FtsK/SpoIIIE domain-containing protein n=1 Tax=uncultured Clostridium sp. TaxID=59620 RepID=UPI0025F6519A|nr:DNA translocase FtsK [uncultured Clostridium sp.]